MDPAEREDLLAAYALGTLSAPDMADVEALVAGDSEAAEQLAAYAEIAELIALSVPLRSADPSLRDRVIRAARGDARRVRRFGRLRRAALPAAMAASLALMSWWVVQLQSTIEDLRADTAQLAAVVEADAKRVEALSRSSAANVSAFGVELATVLQEQQILTAVQTAPDAVSTRLEPTQNGHGAGGRYVWSTSVDAGVLVAHDLPPIPFGAVYRVWLEDRFSRLVGDTTFSPDGLGAAQVVVRVPGEEPPVRLYVVATSNRESTTVEGPVVLQAVVGSHTDP